MLAARVLAPSVQEPEPAPASYLDPAELERDGRFTASTRRWVALGANVIPSKPGLKVPGIAGWGDRQSQDGLWLLRDWGLEPGSLHSPKSLKIPAERLLEWSFRYRGSNPLVFPATLGCMVVDVDDLELLPKVLEACGPTTYRTHSGRVGGGVHLWYLGTTLSKNAVVPHVDVKSTRGYALAPGALHPQTGLEYVPSPDLAAALESGRFNPPPIHSDWRARLQNCASGKVRPVRLDLLDLASNIRANGRKREIGKRLQQVGEGKEFAVDGERDGVLYACLAELAHWWPAADVDYIVALFEPSFAVMAKSQEPFKTPPDEAIRQKWGRVTAHRAEQLDATAQRAEDQRRVAWGLANQDRCDMGDPTDGPIVAHKDRAYYLRIGDQWAGPMSREQISAPDTIAAVRSMYAIDAADFAALLAGWGQPLREVVYSYVETQTSLQPRGRLVVSAAPRRPLTPAYSARFAAGIDALCGQWAPQVRHWLAGLTKQELPCRALVLSGPRGVGKSLVLAGLARLWEHGASQMKHVVGRQFNDELLNSPFAVADDDENPSEQGSALAGYLRQAVSDRSQKVEKKYQDVTRIDGCLRFAVATNDAMGLVQGAIGYKLNDESVSAFADRLLHVPVQASALGWWGTQADAERLVAGDEIARHVLWLAEQEEHQDPQERFWVGAANESLHILAILSSGLRGDILLHIAQGQCSGVSRCPNANYVIETATFVNQWQVERPRGLTLRTGALALKALCAAAPVPQPVSGTKKTCALSRMLVDWYAAQCGL